MALELDARQRAMLQDMGVTVWLPAAVPPAVTKAELPRMPARTPPAAASPAVMPSEALAADGPTLAAQAQACQACGLCAGRDRATLSAQRWPADAAALQADWFIVGDPPDDEENRAGQPFMGQSGQLLDAMLKAVGAQRQGQGRTAAYLSNVVKCHPMPGRVAQVAELAACAPYLNQELALVRPKVVLAMGRFATQLLLQEHQAAASLPLGKQRGTVYRYRGLPVVVTYHPKVLLRASADKAKAWADLCLAMELVDAA